MPNAALPWPLGLPLLTTGLLSDYSVAAHTQSRQKRPCVHSWRAAASQVPNHTTGLVTSSAHTALVLLIPSCTVPGSVPDFTSHDHLSQGRTLAASFTACPPQPAAACYYQAPHITPGLITGPPLLVPSQARFGAMVPRAIRQTPSSDVPRGRSVGRSLTKGARDGGLPQGLSPDGKP